MINTPIFFQHIRLLSVSGRFLQRALLALLLGYSTLAGAGNTAPSLRQYSASFQNTKIQEFVNTVSANLNKTIILDPAVQGSITVRSYDTFDEVQYYQFFLSVLEVNGFAVVEQGNGVLKVIRDKEAKTRAIRVADDSNPGKGDEMVTWVMQVRNVPVRELSPILRQLNDNAGNIVHYTPSNVLLLTGRAGNVERLVNIVQRIDRAGGKSIEIIPLTYGSAAEMARIIKTLGLESSATKGGGDELSVVADDEGNRLIVSGRAEQILRIRKLVARLDQEQKSTGNTRVFYLKYSNAEDIKPVLDGVGKTVNMEKTSGSTAGSGASRFSIDIHKQTNSLVVTARPDMMKILETVIQKLDIRRAQVLVEAIIVELTDGDGINLSLQLMGENGGIMQFQNGSSAPISNVVYGMKAARDKPGSTIDSIDSNGNRITTKNPSTPGDYSVLAKALSGVSGAAFTISSGDWSALLQAVTRSAKSNVLATPSLVTLDNEEASFVVGDEVPTLTGSTSGANNSNPYQTIERKEVGIKLNIKPQINEGNAVKLLIEQEVSNINGSTPVDVTFATRKVKTSVMVGSGDTVVIGGLIDKDVQESVSKVPLLGDIPLLGALFRSTKSAVKKRNLMVFIRPTIVRNDAMLANISGQKYSLIRAWQLDRQEQGIALMPGEDVPLLPEADTLSKPASVTAPRKRRGGGR